MLMASLPDGRRRRAPAHNAPVPHRGAAPAGRLGPRPPVGGIARRRRERPAGGPVLPEPVEATARQRAHRRLHQAPWPLWSIAVCVMIALPVVANAQTIPDRSEAGSVVRRVVEAVIAASGALYDNSAFTGGNFNFRRASLSLTTFAGDLTVAELGDEGAGRPRFQPFVRGLIGWMHLAHDLIPAVDLTVQDLQVGGGGGVDIALTRHLTLTPSFMLVYARTSASLEGTDEGRLPLEPLQGLLYDWNADSLGYVPRVKLGLQVPAGPVVLKAAVEGAYRFTDVLSSTSRHQLVEVSAGLLQARVGVEIPVVTLLTFQLSLQPMVAWTQLFFDAQEALDTNWLLSGGAALYADVEGRSSVLDWLGITEVGLTALYSQGENVTGWSVGFSFNAAL